MNRIRLPGSATLRRALATFGATALLASVAACKSYMFMPVDVTYEKLSPPYVVHILNDMSAPFEVQPSSTGARAGYPPVRVTPGESFKAILQLRRFTVGVGSSVAGAQVLDNPYFEQAGPDKAALRLTQGNTYSIFVAIQDAAWFDGYERPDAAPVEIPVRLREFSRVPLYQRGPFGGPLQHARSFVIERKSARRPRRACSRLWR